MLGGLHFGMRMDCSRMVYSAKNSMLWMSVMLLQLSGIMRAVNATDVTLELVAIPSTQLLSGEQLKLRCSALPSSTPIPPTCQFQWTHAYFSDRDGPIIQTLTNKNYGSGTNGGGDESGNEHRTGNGENGGGHDITNNDNSPRSRNTNTNTNNNDPENSADNRQSMRSKVKVVSPSSPSPRQSVLVVPYMRAPLQGIFRCALLCTSAGTTPPNHRNASDGTERGEKPGMGTGTVSVVAEASIQIRVIEGSVSVWVKKDLAMMMVSAVIVIFVACMLLAGLVLRLRQCHARRQFQREQHRRQRLYDDAEAMIEAGIHVNSIIGNKTSTSSSLSSPPPRYSEVVNSEVEECSENQTDGMERSRRNGDRSTRTLCSRQNSSDSTRALCVDRNGVDGNGDGNSSDDSNDNDNDNDNDSNSPTDQTEQHRQSADEIKCNEANDTTDSKSSMRALCLSPEFLDSLATPDTLYSLMEQSDSPLARSLDRGVLAFQPPPDYEAAVEEMEKQGIRVNPSMLSPMPPAYSELSLHV